jgi:hypothetical protein
MSSALALSAIVILAVLLAIVSALAGVLWSRARSVPLIRVARLAQELADRQQALETLLKRFEVSAKQRPASGVEPPPRPSLLAGATPVHRYDYGQPSAVAGPTLISVPDLSSAAADSAAASAELEQRFGPIWDMAATGAAAEEIARATGHPVGQVELILGLRRQLAAAEGRT